jgi:hypothetical protein
MHLFTVRFYGADAKRYASLKHPWQLGLVKPDPIKVDEITATSRGQAQEIAQLRGERVAGATCFSLEYLQPIRKAAHV